MLFTSDTCGFDVYRLFRYRCQLCGEPAKRADTTRRGDFLVLIFYILFKSSSTCDENVDLGAVTDGHTPHMSLFICKDF